MKKPRKTINSAVTLVGFVAVTLLIAALAGAAQNRHPSLTPVEDVPKLPRVLLIVTSQARRW